MKHRSWIALSGMIWAVIGTMLLYKGLSFLSQIDHAQATWWIGAGLIIGFVKGRLVLSKTVARMCAHIEALPMPIQMATVYPKSYWLLLAGMMGLGFLMRFIPTEFRGCVDVAVGSALVNGAMLYFRRARSLVIAGT